jgi:hypothetical protein
VDEELAGTDLAVLTSQRDALLLGLLEQKAAMDARKPALAGSGVNKLGDAEGRNFDAGMC